MRIAGFSEATYIAIHCMVLIAQNQGERISIKSMADKLSVSEAHLAKIILRLSRSGLIDTLRGPKGGAILARQPEEITFLEIVETIEGPLEKASCVFGSDACVFGSCIFGGFLAKLTEEAKEWLRSKNLSNFKKINQGEILNEKNNQDQRR